MLLTTLIVLTTLLPRFEAPVRQIPPPPGGAKALIAAFEVEHAALPVFQSDARAVSNWRLQAGENLRPGALALVARYSAADPAFVARCVKLNNYWCIKRARWNGEIGADTEGHTGFATAADGADAAAQLLRRYYRALGRRSALAIVRRWAPAECRIGEGAPLAARDPAPKVSADLAPRGIGRTLRARYLARKTRGVPRVAAPARGVPLRIQPWSPLARMGARGPGRVAAAARPAPPARGALLVRPSELLVKQSTLIAKPSVLLVEPGAALGGASAGKPPVPRSRTATAAGLQERFVAESAALPAIATGLPNMPLLDLSVPAPLCANDETRIRNYAARIAGSVGLTIEDDLALFEPDGRSRVNLGPVMLAMSRVELGSLRAGPALVEAAIRRLDAATRASASTPPPTP